MISKWGDVRFYASKHARQYARRIESSPVESDRGGLVGEITIY